jgi:hypothetical protein
MLESRLRNEPSETARLPRYRLDQVYNCYADVQRASYSQQESLGGALRIRFIVSVEMSL